MPGRVKDIFKRVFALKKSRSSDALTEILSKRGKARIYVQVGAGAGDQDSRAGFRDGFSELIKTLPPAEIDRIILVEPNSDNIEGLKRCWDGYGQAEIHQIGIVDKANAGKAVKLYKAAEDGPHFQTASVDPDHVLKHYPNLEISDLVVDTMATDDLTSFLKKIIRGKNIELLCLDIEGLDAKILLETDFRNLNVNLLSVEHLHLGDKTDDVVTHLEKSGFRRVGIGVDHNGYDWLYKRQT